MEASYIYCFHLYFLKIHIICGTLFLINPYKVYSFVVAAYCIDLQYCMVPVTYGWTFR